MGFLMGVLGWPPAAAWAATPREIALALHGRTGGRTAGPLRRADLAALMAAFPDAPSSAARG